MLRSVFPARAVHRLQGLLTEVEGFADTAAAVKLVRRIRALIIAPLQTLLCATIGGPKLAWRVGLPLSAALLGGFAILLSGCDCAQWIARMSLPMAD